MKNVFAAVIKFCCEHPEPRKTFGAVPASGIAQWMARIKGSTVRRQVLVAVSLSVVLASAAAVSRRGLQELQEPQESGLQYSPSFTLRQNTGTDPDVPPLQWVIPEALIPIQGTKPLFHRDFSNERISESDSASYLSMLAFQEFGEELRQLLELGEESLLGGEPPSLAFRKRLKDRAPWLKGSPNDDPHWPFSTLPLPVEGHAVMICAGEPQLAHLKTLVYAIRVIHSSAISIRIIFRDTQDLSAASQRAVLESLDETTRRDIQFIDLSRLFDFDAAGLEAGWNLKPFGLLAVAETEVITLDVDVILLQSPDVLWQHKGYQDQGALFFHDRMFWNLLGYYDPGAFCQALQPHLSETATDLIEYNGGQSGRYRTEFVMESGLVMLDTKRRAKGVWAICLLMGREDIRRYTQGYYMYGDKELYWIGLETVSEPYAFPKYYPGTYSSVVTNFKDNDMAVSPQDETAKVDALLQQANMEHYALCGRSLHFDDAGQPLWSNGGYFTKEEDWKSDSPLAEHPLYPLWYIDGGEWRKEEFIPNVPDDLFPNFLIDQPKINPETKAILQGTKKVWDSVKEDDGVNQYWRIHHRMGVMCLYSNARGIQKVPIEMAKVASDAIQRYFVQERGIPAKKLWSKQ